LKRSIVYRIIASFRKEMFGWVVTIVIITSENKRDINLIFGKSCDIEYASIYIFSINHNRSH